MIQCPNCKTDNKNPKATELKGVRTFNYPDHTERGRKCLKCGREFKTSERFIDDIEAEERRYAEEAQQLQTTIHEHKRKAEHVSDTLRAFKELFRPEV